MRHLISLQGSINIVKTFFLVKFTFVYSVLKMSPEHSTDEVNKLTFKAVSLLCDFSQKDCVILRHNKRPSLLLTPRLIRYLTSYRNGTWTCPIRVPFNHSVQNTK